MRIALVNLTGGGLSGGYRKYLEEIAPRLAAHPEVTDLKMFSPESDAFPAVAGVHQFSWPRHDWVSARSALRSAVRKYVPDVVFIPTARYFASGFPTVTMVRNMEPLVLPFAGNPPTERLRNLMRRRAAKRSCARSTRVIAVSGFVRDFLQQRWHVPAGNIGVVFHGVNDPLTESSWRRPALAAPADDGTRWIFTAGSIRPARGLEDFVAAAAELRKRGNEPRILVAGDVGSRAAGRYRERLVGSATGRGVEDCLIFLGALSQAEMAWCFANCTVFAMTSRVEACPNTALEALSYGSRCVAADNPPLPEIFLDAADYYPAGDGRDLGVALHEALSESAGARADRRDRALARASAFDWTLTADQTVLELKHALGRTA